MPLVIELEPVSRYHAETYNMLYEGKFLHRIKGAKHNRNAQFRLTVWDNTKRLNDCPEGKWNNMGRYGGPGKYLDPHNIGTDEELTITSNAESVVISAQPIRGKREGSELEIGQLVLFGIPDGSLIGPYKIDQKPLHDPHFAPQAL